MYVITYHRCLWYIKWWNLCSFAVSHSDKILISVFCALRKQEFYIEYLLMYGTFAPHIWLYVSITTLLRTPCILPGYCVVSKNAEFLSLTCFDKILHSIFSWMMDSSYSILFLNNNALVDVCIRIPFQCNIICFGNPVDTN